ncbi:hypothetical protein H6F93_01395 [Leptolyngbya sp. FACHB-671]|uniref:hypothetical protein n=1 Tax=Leptolyngbya sp. FACHB-671 TaxID=2692812 RepID=UPI001681ECD3|nr:hypothetical protein [Leptolyngbya sp. FACHB-671]MBD2066194.1 hypothetical protein [Leptolyngbya sp. FACHB-671]
MPTLRHHSPDVQAQSGKVELLMDEFANQTGFESSIETDRVMPHYQTDEKEPLGSSKARSKSKHKVESTQPLHTEDASPTSKPKRMSISLTATDVEKLNWLAESQDISQSEALRKAIATEQYIQRAIQAGSRIIVEKPDGTKMEVVFR